MTDYAASESEKLYRIGNTVDECTAGVLGPGIGLTVFHIGAKAYTNHLVTEAKSSGHPREIKIAKTVDHGVSLALLVSLLMLSTGVFLEGVTNSIFKKAEKEERLEKRLAAKTVRR